MAELRRIDPVVGAPRGGRSPLRDLDAVTREAFESARGVIDGDAAIAAWERARGFALHQAAMIIPYYGETNPGFVSLARCTEEILADIDT